MDFNKFLPSCKVLVSRHMNENTVTISAEDVFVVWYSKTLQNAKAILGVPGSPRLFEITYNGDKDETYMDVYTKESNHKF